MNILMVDLHLFAFNCNESFRIVVDKKEKRAKLFCLTLSISLFYLECFRINLLSPPVGQYFSVCPACRSFVQVIGFPQKSGLSFLPDWQ